MGWKANGHPGNMQDKPFIKDTGIDERAGSLEKRDERPGFFGFRKGQGILGTSTTKKHSR